MVNQVQECLGAQLCGKSPHSFRQGNQLKWSMAFTIQGLSSNQKPEATYSITVVGRGVRNTCTFTHRSLRKRMGQVCLHLSHPPPHAMLPRCWGLPSPPQLQSRKSCRWVYIPARYQGLQGHPLQSQAHTRHSMHSWEMDFRANSEMENHS